MRGVLSSPRRRRRLAWLGAAALAVGSAVGVAVKFRQPTPSVEPTSNAPAQIVEQEREVPVTRDRGGRVLTVAADFVRTAVARRNVAQSYDLVTPSLKQGYTRSEWARGDIPVVPYPVHSAKWDLGYSLENELGLRVALFPKKGSRVRAVVFDLALKRFGSGKGERWLVDGFTPAAMRAQRATGPPRNELGLPQIEFQGEGKLGAIWLLVPLGILSLVLLVPVTFGALRWYRGAQAVKAYERERRPLDRKPYEHG